MGILYYVFLSICVMYYVFLSIYIMYYVFLFIYIPMYFVTYPYCWLFLAGLGLNYWPKCCKCNRRMMGCIKSTFSWVTNSSLRLYLFWWYCQHYVGEVLVFACICQSHLYLVFWFLSCSCTSIKHSFFCCSFNSLAFKSLISMNLYAIIVSVKIRHVGSYCGWC